LGSKLGDFGLQLFDEKFHLSWRLLNVGDSLVFDLFGALGEL
jgi:hypothetical protein